MAIVTISRLRIALDLVLRLVYNSSLGPNPTLILNKRSLPISTAAISVVRHFVCLSFVVYTGYNIHKQAWETETIESFIKLGL